MASLDGLKSFLKKYDQVIESRKANTDICASEFHAIKLQSVEDKRELPAFEGARDPNKKKNRYKDILPYDHSRVVLDKNQFIDGSDYINANHVMDENGVRAYIAAQGPMPHTTDDFWRMIWQFKIKVVVMGCKEVEMGKNRCHRYWAEAGEETWFHDIKVTLVESKSYAHNMMLRELKAEKNGATHFLTQLHYMDWPDHGAPETTETILQLIQVLRERHPTDDPPLLIHCSAGCGRTGAIIATDIGKKMIDAHASDIDILTIVTRMRKQRPALVQSKEQYEFIYEVFREMITREIQRYEKQFSSDYMNINYFPVKKTDGPVIIDLPTINPRMSSLPALPTQHADNFTSHPAVSLPYAIQEAVVKPPARPELTTEERRQIILPSEHVVNTDSGVIRRSRSAYGKKIKGIDIKRVSAGPPEVPEKASSRERLNEGPAVPPKSPTSRQKPSNFTSNMQTSTNMPANVPPMKPALLKKPGLDPLRTCRQESDYLHLEGPPVCVSPEEDFIPKATPVSFTQYPMRPKTSTTHPALPMKPGAVNKDILAKGLPTVEPQKNKELSMKELSMSFQTNQTFYTPEENVKLPRSSNVFGATSATFDTSLVKKTNAPSSGSKVDDYAVVDMSKKTTKRPGNIDVPHPYEKSKDTEPVRLTGVPEYISGNSVVRTGPEKYNGTYMQIDTLSLQTDSHLEKAKDSPPSIKPYTVTEVGMGYKNEDMQAMLPSPLQSGPPLPNRRGVTSGLPNVVPPRSSYVAPDDGLYSEINSLSQHAVEHQPGGKVLAPQFGPLNSKMSKINDKLKMLGKRTSNSSITVENAWSHSFDICDKYGFPNRLPVKPTGARPPPSWTS